MMRCPGRSLASSAAIVAVASAALVVAGQSAGTAAAPGYVGIVIAGNGYACVPWHSGISGDEVLNDAATVTYRRDGLIVQIDGDPSSGTADASHYWSYWHDTGPAWHYSTAGGSGYRPAAGSVEGWSYVDGGTASPPAQAASGLYAAICSRKVVTRASHPASPKPRSTAKAQPAVRSRSRAAGSTAPASATTTSRAASASATARATRPGSSAKAVEAGPIGAAKLPSSASNPVAGLSSLPPRTNRASERTNKSSGSVLAVVIGLALALLIGGAAGATIWRRRWAEAAVR
jgi:hypothetical protein